MLFILSILAFSFETQVTCENVEKRQEERERVSIIQSE